MTKRNGLPQAKLAEIDDAIMGISEALREARTLTRSTDPVVLAATVKLGIRHGRRGTYAAAREADRYDLISNVQHLADNPVRIRFSGSGYQAADRQALVLLAAAWWEHADIHSTLKCRCLPVRSNVNDRMREGAGSFGNFSKPNIAQRDSV